MTAEPETPGRPLEGAPLLDSEQIDGLIAAAGVCGAQEILDAFWRSTDKLLQALYDQLSTGDFDEASRTAHALKGSSLNVGAMSLSCAARAIEDACRTGDGSGALDRLSTAKSRYAETADAFASHLASAA